ncbi:nuclear pore complex protein Nup153 isoform X4 [Acanthochromis polyacanthus]|uniref:nuclear pore complex protein Nup153 isoform X4 n=1 Tax=Acanthochromis polyacanthus TaxID=80966 RepID=UPI0022343441|nr:nuclear pore complex protein Nup153 isoform X4 [Acanthochromis polyacanthus]
MTAIRRRNTDRHSDERAMAATGGGKIRSRRYHIASKPYAKSKQQQSGLISRVTDTVKSIVPSWLQKYFKNEDAPEGGETVQGPNRNCQPPPPPNGSEEGPSPLDGRDSPEPSTSNTEPSTSRASLNFQEYVLSRPPLSRSHLHFTPLDPSAPTLGASSSLFSQPSTSSAPGPFSTGFSLVKEIKDNLSQHEDDNISTTSGFSSRASDKDVPTSKAASLPQLWSPETDRTNCGPQPSQSSQKKPAFNLSVFGTSSNSTLNSTVLSSSQLGDSPFYPGKTTYGGAAAVRSSRTRPGTPYQAPVRRQIKAKPAGAQPCGVTSATARRILQSLERMSSPLADAKRIPAAASSPLSTSMDGINLDASHLTPKKKRVESTLPPVQKLVVPATASVSGNRSVSFRATLTPGGVSRTLDRATRETPTRQSPQLLEATPGPSQRYNVSASADQAQVQVAAADAIFKKHTKGSSGPAYPLSSTPAASSVSSGGGKMKRERSSARPSSKHQEDDEVAEVPDLPTISLPIGPSALPTFSFSSPLPPVTTSTTVSSTPKTMPVTPAKETDPPKASTPPCVPFTFSSPIVKATAASPPSFSPSAGFTFSAPVTKLGPSMSNGKLTTPIAATVKPATNKSTEDFEGPFKPAKTLKQGSVLDLLKAPGFASPVAQISPSSDAAPQQTSTQSTAPSSTSTTTSSLAASTGFGSLFKASTDWSCDVCLVQNKSSDTKCVCCAAPQPNSSKSIDSKPSLATSVGQENSSSSTNTTSTTTTTTGFGTMFSKPAGTWDCDTCLVLNKPDAVKCVACETAKPGTGLKPSLTLPSAFSAVKTVSAPAAPVSTGFSGFGDKFKKPEGAWECDTCMVQNKAEDTKCVACTNPKPGASAGASSTASSAPVFGLGDKFKKPEGTWDCDVCLLQNKAADLQCVACQAAKPGANVEPKAFGSSGSSAGATSGSSTFGSSTSSSGGFKFGTSDSTSGSGSGGFKFGGSLSESSSASSGGFKFGVSFGSSSSEATSKDTTASSGFKFGSSSEGFKFGAASSDDKKSDQPAAGSGFKFGVSGGIAFGTGSSSTESNSSKSGFTFGLSKPEEKTSDATTTSSSTVTFTPPSSQEKSDSVASTNTNLTTTTTTTIGSVFGRLGEPVSPQAASTFGSLQPGKEPAAPTFTFGKPEEKKEAVASSAPSSFLFGGASKDADSAPVPAATGGFSFGKPSAPAEQPPPAFTFGKPADKSETSTSEAPKASFTFGQSAADSSAAAPKPAFSFMTSNPTNATNSTTSSSSTPTPSLFGTTTVTTTSSSSSSSTPAPAPSAAPSTFMFGQSAAASSDAPPAKTFLFGQSQDSQPPAPSAAPLNSAPAPAPAQPFIFGAPANAAPPPAAAPSFGFGATAPSAASSSAAASTAPSPFAFSSAPSAGFGANQTPSFGSSFGSPFPATPSQAPAFGAKPSAAPVFGQQTNSTPVFGAAANAAPGGGFQFGGSGGFGATNNASGVFTFGAGSAASPAPPANPSMAPQSGAPGGGFNFTQPPTFNIGSTKSFTASPAGQQPIAGRKIKTAVRRRK